MSLSADNLPDAEQLCEQLADQLQALIQENNIDNPFLVGIRTGGAWIADRLQQKLQLEEPGILDISFYRDDFSQRGLAPQVKGSDLPDSIEDRHIILVDDVIMSGRTIRAAMNELFDFGRPASIHLVTLLDVGRRQLPIQPDLCAARIALNDDQAIKLTGPEPLELSLV